MTVRELIFNGATETAPDWLIDTFQPSPRTLHDGTDLPTGCYNYDGVVECFVHEEGVTYLASTWLVEL